MNFFFKHIYFKPFKAYGIGFFLGVFVFCANVLFAQEYNLKNYTSSNGLSSDAVWSICQDNDGYIWIGTSSGLDKFDGDNFVNYNKSHGLDDNEILEIYLNQNRNQLILKPFSNYLSIVQNGMVKGIKQIPALLKYKSLTKQTGISFNKNNTAFIYLDRSTHLVNLNNFREIQEFKGSSNENIIKFFYNGDKIFKITNSGTNVLKLYVVESNLSCKLVKQWTGVPLVKIKLNNFKNGINQLFDSENNLYSFDENTLELKKIIKLNTEISALLIDKDSIVWYGKNNGIWWCNLKEKNPKRHQLLKGIVVSNVIEDRNGNIWIGTLDYGLFLLRNKNIFSQRFSYNNINLPINRILKGKDHTILGHVNNDFSILEKNQISKHFFFDSIQRFNRTLGLLTLDGKDFIVNEFGIYDLETQKIVYKDQAIKSFVKLGNSCILVGTIHGITKLCLNKGTFKVLDHSYYRRVSDICLLDSTTVFGGNLEGVFTYNLITKKAENIFIEGNIKSIRVNKVLNLGQNKIVVLTSHDGVFLYQNKHLKRILQSSRLLNSDINSAVFYKDSIAFFATSTGIVKIKYSKDYLVKNEFFINEEIGLLFNKVNHISLLDSTIWATTSKGISYFNVNTLFEYPSLEIKFTKLVINDSKIVTDSFPNVLEPDENNFSISFNTFSFREKNGIKYCYTINRDQTRCTFSTANSIVFADLPHGYYTFRVFASDLNNNNNTSKVITWNFIIEPRFYESWFFYFFIAVFSLIAAVLIIYLRLEYLNKKYKRKQEFEVKISQMELKALRSQLDPHFIFNALNSIKDYIKKNDIQSSKQYLNDFSIVMRYTLDSSRKNRSLLSDELKYIRTYLSIEAMRFGNRFGFIIEYEDEVFPETIAIPSMMLQTFIENCIKHGKVGSQTYAGLIEIYISLIADDRILIKILDNGIGLSKTNFHDNGNPSKSVHSNQIQFERIEMFNKINREKIHVKLGDREDGLQGAQLSIELPMLFYAND